MNNPAKGRLRPSSGDSGPKLGLVQIRKLSDIRPAPENKYLYRAIVNDAEMRDLVKSIGKFGVKTPLTVSMDGWLLSGHRRLFACKLAGLETAPCIIDASINRKLDPDAFIRSLREHNRQRVKGLDEVAAEVAIDMRGEDANAHLIKERRLAARIKVEPMDLGAWVKRSDLSTASQPMIDAINRVLEELRDYWPVTLRTIHYNLLNDPPLMHASKPDSVYQNDLKSSHKLSDVATRGRLTGVIPIEAIDDDTREETEWQTWDNPDFFIKEQFEDLLTGYVRNKLQSQPNHFEMVVEKNTIKNYLKEVAADFGIHVVVGRGQPSIPPRRNVANRFWRSGKEKLVLSLSATSTPMAKLSSTFGRDH